MRAETAGALLRRELKSMRDSVAAYPDDAGVWAEHAGLANPGGTLVLHLCGNLQHFIGAVLGGTGYRRDRDAEFSRRGASRAELIAEIDAADRAVEQGLARVNDKQLDDRYPLDLQGRVVRTGDMLAHLVAHAAYHLGQLEYHRRVTTGDATAVSAVSWSVIPEYEGG